MRSDLTPSELRTLKLIAKGLSAKEAGKLAGIAYDTIKDQMASVYRRLGASNAAHAVALAFVGGIIKPEDLQ